jgi:hypothetical protein
MSNLWLHRKGLTSNVEKNSEIFWARHAERDVWAETPSTRLKVEY